MKEFAEELQRLKSALLRMCEHSTAMIRGSVQALLLRDTSISSVLYELETEVNTLQREIDDQASRLLALRQPVAQDLRFIIAAMKISSDLERISDQSISLLKHAEKVIAFPDVNPQTDMPEMSEDVIAMVRDALSAYVLGDTVTAREVLQRDDRVDFLKDKVIDDLIQYMITDPRSIKPGLQLVLAARNLERIADHATNIAEDVVYLVESKDVRHHSENSVS